MTTKPVSCITAETQSRLVITHADACIRDVAKLLGSTQRSMVVVCDQSEKMIGVITKTNIVRQIGHCEGQACRTLVTELMIRDVAFCHQDDLLSDVLAKMAERGFVHFPVIDDDFRPVGIVNARDALRALLADEVYEESLLRNYVMGVGYQ